jgi:hypothetical protein
MSDRLHRLHPHEREAIAGWLAPGLHVDLLGDPDLMRAWSVLRREPGRALLVHSNRALAWVDVEGDRVVGHRLVEGDEARDLHARLGAG